MLLPDTPKNIGEVYADRSMKPNPENTPPAASYAQPAREVTPFTSTGPFIYNGERPGPFSQDDFVRQTIAARNKAINRRRVSTFNLMLSLIAAAVGIVLYIGNVIAVEQLLKDVNDEQQKLRQILDGQEMLKAQINRMSSLERIRKMAEADLGLRNPNTSPQWIVIEGDKVREIQEQLTLQHPESRKSK